VGVSAALFAENVSEAGDASMTGRGRGVYFGEADAVAAAAAFGAFSPGAIAFAPPLQAHLDDARDRPIIQLDGNRDIPPSSDLIHDDGNAHPENDQGGHPDECEGDDSGLSLGGDSTDEDHGEHHGREEFVGGGMGRIGRGGFLVVVFASEGGVGAIVSSVEGTPIGCGAEGECEEEVGGFG